jgi:ketopantoate reductase
MALGHRPFQDRGRHSRLELPWLGGKVVEHGGQLDVPMPTHKT